ncbi:hypothetical protein F5144DRAFT_530843 [Chaetomium tenue]|uniref:Uncharacterized protein n=1 Tax=Chaetomium tenue TaxID=1854479 RepID=A0ACB7PCH9_9PEZI|nr:hypothetical protein F5144DRAFT_530843 [Chaetomium globosum]
MTSLPPLEPNYATALQLIDEAHAADPRTVPSNNPDDDTPIPFELDYARKMTRWLAVREPNASPALQLACRAQHFRRWELPRTSHPPTRPGYLTWRAKQKSQAATQLTTLLTSTPTIQPPLPLTTIDRIAALIRKDGLSGANANEETQILEDVACLVFLDGQLEGFERESGVEEAKLVGILRKTWGKMSERGRELALGMELGERARVLVGKALEGEGEGEGES